MPRNPLSRFCAGVPCAAFSAILFLTTRYRPPASRIALRSWKSWLTVSFSYLVTKMFLELSIACFSSSNSLRLLSLFFIARSLYRLHVECCYVQRYARPHGGANGSAFYIFAFCGCRLGSDHRLDQRIGVFEQLGRREAHLAYGSVNDTCFIHAKLYLACFGLLDRFGDLSGYCTGFRVWHESARSQNFSEPAHRAHHIGGCNHRIEVEPVFILDAIDDFFATGEIGPGFERLSNLISGSDHQNSLGFAQTVGQNHGTAHHLIGMFRIDA